MLLWCDDARDRMARNPPPACCQRTDALPPRPKRTSRGAGFALFHGRSSGMPTRRNRHRHVGSQRSLAARSPHGRWPPARLRARRGHDHVGVDPMWRPGRAVDAHARRLVTRTCGDISCRPPHMWGPARARLARSRAFPSRRRRSSRRRIFRRSRRIAVPRARGIVVTRSILISMVCFFLVYRGSRPPSLHQPVDARPRSVLKRLLDTSRNSPFRLFPLPLHHGAWYSPATSSLLIPISAEASAFPRTA